ncbi:Flp pilus assembly protein TadG [Hartmannibacter diazotrophicus]|uniref:Flp pilus assembly protein TadG n=1 Tax=Hartmannibacter diazotrophicus TaxID=1482074 RepID=A0A2C9DDJ5_9HYPH|nr:pilus assembly protein [Hartmannibacter diazotrophicus]SON58229.1 Flp pilus assembly protein TadG [Hartmannibacter diazotrophicus]
MKKLKSSVKRAVPFGKTLLRAFVSDRSGNFAIMAAFMSLVLFGAAGMAIDYSRAAQQRTKMQIVTDMAALAIAKDIEAGMTSDEIEAHKDALVALNMNSTALENFSLTYTQNATTGTVTATASASMPTTFMGLLNISDMDLGISSTVQNGVDYAEIGLVLDTTGSMGNPGSSWGKTKLDDLKDAAKSLLTTIQNSEAGKKGRTSVAVIPYAVTVNVGTSYSGANWLGPKDAAYCTTWYFDYSTWTYKCSKTSTSWLGCVGDRSGTYLNNISISSPPTTAEKYPRASSYCYDQGTPTALKPLTTDYSGLATMVGNLKAGGNTNIPIGLLWGWNSLSPGKPTSNAATETSTRKISRYLVLLTDGENTQSTLTSNVSTIDSSTTATCTNIKNSDITIFTIRVIDGDEALLKSCATAESYYYNVTNPGALTSVFQEILSVISRLRVSA